MKITNIATRLIGCVHDEFVMPGLLQGVVRRLEKDVEMLHKRTDGMLRGQAGRPLKTTAAKRNLYLQRQKCQGSDTNEKLDSSMNEH